jgi:L-lysine 6-transaminase
MKYERIAPAQVDEIMHRHILKDGMDMVMDLKRSQGAWVYDSKHDRKLLDFFTCFATIPLGYNHPAMTGDPTFKEALLEAALINPSNSDVYTQHYAHFLDTFGRVAKPDYMRYAFFISGGALAIENALKVAMDWKVQKNFQKGYTKEIGHRVMHFKDAFHGRSGYTMTLTNTDPAKTRYFAQFPDWPRISNPKMVFPYTDARHEDLLQREAHAIAQVKQAIREAHDGDDICALVVEPIQSEGGDHHFRTEFMVQLRDICTAHDILLIYDEVQVGVGATGKFWAHEHFGAEARPDMIVFGKKMQICGLLCGPRIDEIETNCFKVPSRINSTWGGSLVDMVRADKILQTIADENVLANVQASGEVLLSGLASLSERYAEVTNARGRGLICAFDLPTRAYRDAFIVHGLQHNALFLGCSERTIRFRPTLTITPDEIRQGLVVIEAVLKELAAK